TAMGNRRVAGWLAGCAKCRLLLLVRAFALAFGNVRLGRTDGWAASAVAVEACDLGAHDRRRGYGKQKQKEGGAEHAGVLGLSAGPPQTYGRPLSFPSI